MTTEATDLAKATTKTLASHFKKAAEHEKTLAAIESQRHDTHSDRAKEVKSDKDAQSFHKAMAASHEKCMKAHEAPAAHCSHMVQAYTDVAEKTASADGLAKTSDSTLKGIFEEAFARAFNTGELTGTSTDEVRALNEAAAAAEEIRETGL